jgi:hypothetical protein
VSRDFEALTRFLEERGPRPFAWGARGNDCVAFAAGAVAAQIGSDPLAGLQWESAEQARTLLRAEGGMRAALDRRFCRIPAAMAQRGDIAGVACREFGTRLMIVEGETLAGPGDRGTRRMRREAMIVAWSVSEPKAGRR